MTLFYHLLFFSESLILIPNYQHMCLKPKISSYLDLIINQNIYPKQFIAVGYTALLAVFRAGGG